MTTNSVSAVSSAEEAGAPKSNDRLAPTEHNARLQRDGRGRFLTGNGGGGRKKGSRNKLTDLVLSCVADDFRRYGKEALKDLRDKDPESYLRLVSSLVPRQLVLERERESDFSDLSIEEAEELIMRARQHRLISRAMQTS